MISVIVPVWNAQNYIEDCVRSVLAQSRSELELLLVDDGSDDASGAICDAWSARDDRIRVIHKENGGVSSARNAGLDAARGELFFFADSDDILPPEALETLLRAHEEHSADYTVGAIRRMQSRALLSPAEAPRLLRHDRDAAELLRYLTSPGSYSVYARLYNGRIIRDHRLRFDETLPCGEDAVFLRQYLAFCRTSLLLPDVVYWYNDGNAGSISRRAYPEYAECFYRKLLALETLTEQLPLSEAQRRAFLKERAVHGLRVSAGHYLRPCFSREESRQGLCRARELFTPWLSAEETIPDGTLRRWWKKNSPVFRETSLARFIRRERLCLGLRRRLSSLRKYLRRAIAILHHSEKENER